MHKVLLSVITNNLRKIINIIISIFSIYFINIVVGGVYMLISSSTTVIASKNGFNKKMSSENGLLKYQQSYYSVKRIFHIAN